MTYKELDKLIERVKTQAFGHCLHENQPEKFEYWLGLLDKLEGRKEKAEK